MPPDLRRAHHTLDRTVGRLYRRSGIASERKRVEHLFALYEKMRAPLEAWERGTKEGKLTDSVRYYWGIIIYQ